MPAKADHIQRQQIAFRLDQQGVTNARIAQIVGVGFRTVQRWRAHGFDGRDDRGRPVEYDQHLIAPLLRDYIRENNEVTQKEMLKHLEYEYDVVPSGATVCRMLQKDDVTNKKLVYAYGECTQSVTDTFKQNIQNFNGTLLALDEAGFHLNHARKFGWSPKGRRARHEKPGARGGTYSLLLCVAKRAHHPIVKWELYPGAVDSLRFHDFLRDLPIQGPTALILDNAAIHRGNQVLHSQGRQSIRELADSRNLQLMFMPPYVPAVNPTEWCFNTIRTSVASLEPRTEEDLEMAIQAGIDNMSHSMVATFNRALLENCKPLPEW